MNVVYSYSASLNAMNCISIHEFFSGRWAETEITISLHALCCPDTVLPFDLQIAGIVLSQILISEIQEEIGSVMQRQQTITGGVAKLSHSGVMLSLCSHSFLTVSFHSALEPVFLYLLFQFTFSCYLIKNFVCKACEIVCYFFITHSKVWRHICTFIFNAHSIE